MQIEEKKGDSVMQEKSGISGSTLKIIAVVSMLIDHTAAVLLGSALVEMGFTSVADYSPSYIRGLMNTEGLLAGMTYLLYQIMRRVIGRIAFPIYCFLLVEGFLHTRNSKKYALRLLLFAFISEIPFDLAFYGTLCKSESQNVFFTLFLGFLLMAGFEKLSKSRYSLWVIYGGQLVLFLLTAAAANRIGCDYGEKGILAIAVLYLFRKNKVEQIIAGCVSFFWKIMAIPAFIPIAFYNGKRGFDLKYFFYLFYPVHLLLLYGIQCICFS